MRPFCNPTIGELTFEVFTTLSQVPAEWDTFLPDYHPLKSSELRVLEEAGPGDLLFGYITVRRGQTLIGVVSVQVIEIKPEYFRSSARKTLVMSGLKEFIYHHPQHLLVCGNVFRNQVPGFYFSRKEEQGLIFEALKRFGNKNPYKLKFAGSLIKDWADNLITAEEYGFRTLENDLLMEMSLPSEWQSLQDYEAKLSKKYLQRFRKIRSARNTIEVRTLEEHTLPAISPQLEKLFRNVCQQQPFRLGTLPGNYFLHLKQSLGKRLELTGYFLDGQLVAFSSLLHQPHNELEIYLIGLDYTANEKFSLYFNLLFDGLETAIRQRKRLLSLGRTGFDAKASLGAVPVEKKHLIRLKRGIPSMAFRYLNTWFRQLEKPGWKSRNPLAQVTATQVN